ncbi:phospholipase A [uncultured Dechloromonas sp.]|uniref:phospholipase A n=1 Tax=uncultured Dechloromonas sp. TaxID=171719 RepID=UPI0025EA61B2|nr:phospholipase A [uncultured Dechloromonas sp.]
MNALALPTPSKLKCRTGGYVIRTFMLTGLFASQLAVGANNADLSACGKIKDDQQRLGCYDLAVRQVDTAKDSLTVAISDNAGSSVPLRVARTLDVTPLSKHWEIDPESKNGLWSFRAHKPNYFLLGRYTDKINYQPYETYFRAVNDPNIGLNHTESKFQLSFKLKAAEDLFGRGIDLWLGYTQQNYWQVYNKNISAPFRETNYEPEAFVTIPTDYNLLGLNGRFVNIGFVHQSNGQSYLLSRSWNRIYAQAGFEYGDNFSLLFKPWYRIPEKATNDDNPHITDYMGNFELVANYKLGKHSFSALGRSTFDFNRGHLQLDWSYPLYQKLRGYVQFTTGYGESLIDYNHHQNTFGIGVMLTDWK